jgi:predicted ATPase
VRASLDWSYALLTEAEQTVLRRLAVFAGSFTLQAAARLAADAMPSESETVDQVAALVAKSLVASDMDGSEPRLRLLQTTRAYAREKLAESGEADAMAHHPAEDYRGSLRVAA